MDSSIISSSASLLDLLKSLTGVLASVLAIVGALASTRSAQVLKDRINDNAGIKRRFNDEKLQKQADLEDDVHTFNMRYGLGIETPQAMHKIHTWAQRHRLRLIDLRKARPYFNPNNLEFKIPADRKSRWNSLGAVVLVILCLVAIVFLANPFAWISIKKTGTQMWARPGEAYSFNSPLPSMLKVDHAWKVSVGECLLVPAEFPLGSQWDKDVACYLISGQRDKDLRSAVAAQRLGALSLLIVLTIPSVPFTLEFRRKKAARQLKNLVNERS